MFKQYSKFLQRQLNSTQCLPPIYKLFADCRGNGKLLPQCHVPFDEMFDGKCSENGAENSKKQMRSNAIFEIATI